MSIILITGANKGLGREAARRLIADGHDVWAAARDPQRGRATAEEIGARPLVLDVTDDASIKAAAETVADATGGTLDVLINNAGVPGTLLDIEEVTAESILEVHDVNVLGPIRVLHTFLPLLNASNAPVVVNVSSGLGSLTRHSMAIERGDGLAQRAGRYILLPAYSSSKAALNMLTLEYAQALPNIRINSVAPGFTATDFNNNEGPQTVTEGTDAIVRMATIGPDGPTGTFVDRDGPVDW